MALKSILTAALVTAASAAFAQNWMSDSVALGAGYANDAYYDLKTGAAKYQSGSDWHLAFQTGVFGEKHFTAGVRANHAKTGMQVFLLNTNASSTFASLTAADTVGKTDASMQLHNNDSSWGTGAFYQNRATTDPFDFGWGQYQSSPTYSLLGNQTYLLKTNSGAFKFWMKEYISTPADSIHYTFRIAKLDGSDDREVKIYRKGSPMFTDRLMGYYNIDSARVVDREPSRSGWNFAFTQYKDVALTQGSVVPTVTGVLTNEGTMVADVRRFEPDPSQYGGLGYTSRMDEIGSDWKTYDYTSGKYTLDSLANYFVKTGVFREYYQVQFTRFDGSATGKIVFRKRYLGRENVGVKNMASALNAFLVVPNPAAADANLMIDAKNASPNARLMVTDMAGRVVANGTLNIRSGMNAFSLGSGNWVAGTYAVTVIGTDWKMTSQLVVVR